MNAIKTASYSGLLAIWISFYISAWSVGDPSLGGVVMYFGVFLILVAFVLSLIRRKLDDISIVTQSDSVRILTIVVVGVATAIAEFTFYSDVLVKFSRVIVAVCSLVALAAVIIHANNRSSH
jgi:hypothetical protein